MSHEINLSKAPLEEASSSDSLADAVYRPNLAGDNKALRGTNPLVAIPTTIVTYVCVALFIFWVATQTEAGKKAIEKTIGVILEEKEDDVEDLPPPPPPPPAPTVVQTRIEIKDAPPPPPVAADQEVIPDEAPKVIPTIDYSKSFAGQKPDDSGTSGVGTTGSVTPTSAVGTRTQTDVVHNVSFSQLRVSYRPPDPPYPPMARRARIQGTVVVELTIGTDGVPLSAHVTSGPSALHSHAVEHAKKFRFHPYMVDGVPQQAKFKIEFPYKL